MQNNENNTINMPKVSNHLEISKLTKEDVNTTTPLPKRTYQKGNSKSSFYDNITKKSKFLNENLREMMKDEKNIQYYKEITNKDTLEKAYEKLKEGGIEETAKLRGFNWNELERVFIKENNITEELNKMTIEEKFNYIANVAGVNDFNELYNVCISESKSTKN